MMTMFKKKQCVRFWSPINDLKQEGVWIDDNTGETAKFFDWMEGEPNGREKENCGTVVPPGKQLLKDYKTHKRSLFFQKQLRLIEAAAWTIFAVFAKVKILLI